MKNTIPKKIPVLFSWPKKIPASFIDPKKSLLAKMSDTKKSFGPPVIKICEWGPWRIVIPQFVMDVFSNRYEAHNLKLNRGFAAPNHFDAPNMSYHLSSKCQLFKSWIVLSTGQLTIHRISFGETNHEGHYQVDKWLTQWIGIVMYPPFEQCNIMCSNCSKIGGHIPPDKSLSDPSSLDNAIHLITHYPVDKY